MWKIRYFYTYHLHTSVTRNKKHMLEVLQGGDFFQKNYWHSSWTYNNIHAKFQHVQTTTKNGHFLCAPPYHWPDPRRHGLPNREVHSPKQGNTIEKGKNIPYLFRIYTDFVFYQRDERTSALPFHPHF